MELDMHAFWALVEQKGYVIIPMSAGELADFLQTIPQYDPQIRWSGFGHVDTFTPLSAFPDRQYLMHFKVGNYRNERDYLRMTYAFDDEETIRNEHFISLDDILVRRDCAEIDAETLKSFDNFL